jgi:hypothetical protein
MYFTSNCLFLPLSLERVGFSAKLPFRSSANDTPAPLAPQCSVSKNQQKNESTMRTLPANTATIAAINAALRGEGKTEHGAGAHSEHALVRKLSAAFQNSWSSLRRRSSGRISSSSMPRTRVAPGSPHPLRSSARRAPSGLPKVKKALEHQKTDELVAAASKITLDDGQQQNDTSGRRTVRFSSDPAHVIPYEVDYLDENEPKKPMRSAKSANVLHSSFIQSAAEHPDLVGVFNMLDSYSSNTQAVA